MINMTTFIRSASLVGGFTLLPLISSCGSFLRPNLHTEEIARINVKSQDVLDIPFSSLIVEGYKEQTMLITLSDEKDHRILPNATLECSLKNNCDISLGVTVVRFDKIGKCIQILPNSTRNLYSGKLMDAIIINPNGSGQISGILRFRILELGVSSAVIVVLHEVGRGSL